jgi:hypothetical protein
VCGKERHFVGGVQHQVAVHERQHTVHHLAEAAWILKIIGTLVSI